MPAPRPRDAQGRYVRQSPLPAQPDAETDPFGTTCTTLMVLVMAAMLVGCLYLAAAIGT